MSCSPQAGSMLLICPTSFVPHGAGHSSSSVCVVRSPHSKMKSRGQSSVSTNGIVPPPETYSCGKLEKCQFNYLLPCSHDVLHQLFSIWVAGFITLFLPRWSFKPTAHSLNKSFIPIISQHWQKACLGLCLSLFSERRNISYGAVSLP